MASLWGLEAHVRAVVGVRGGRVSVDCQVGVLAGGGGGHVGVWVWGPVAAGLVLHGCLGYELGVWDRGI